MKYCRNKDYGIILTQIGTEVSKRERERESLLAQILNNFIQIKAKALGHRKKTVKQVVSSGAPWQFHKFLLWCKFDGRIIANLLRLLFWRGCSLLDDQHSCAGVLGRNRYLSWWPSNCVNQIQSCIFKTHSKSYHSPKCFSKVRS